METMAKELYQTPKGKIVQMEKENIYDGGIKGLYLLQLRRKLLLLNKVCKN